MVRDSAVFLKYCMVENSDLLQEIFTLQHHARKYYMVCDIQGHIKQTCCRPCTGHLSTVHRISTELFLGLFPSYDPTIRPTHDSM